MALLFPCIFVFLYLETTRCRIHDGLGIRPDGLLALLHSQNYLGRSLDLYLLYHTPFPVLLHSILPPSSPPISQASSQAGTRHSRLNSTRHTKSYLQLEPASNRSPPHLTVAPLTYQPQVLDPPGSGYRPSVEDSFRVGGPHKDPSRGFASVIGLPFLNQLPVGPSQISLRIYARSHTGT
jgi:hypothetical protein